jgi:hypothetical protein
VVAVFVLPADFALRHTFVSTSTGGSFTVMEYLTAAGWIENSFRESGQPAVKGGAAPKHGVEIALRGLM